mgnify:CR=1 FL=1
MAQGNEGMPMLETQQITRAEAVLLIVLVLALMGVVKKRLKAHPELVAQMMTACFGSPLTASGVFIKV